MDEKNAFFKFNQIHQYIAVVALQTEPVNCQNSQIENETCWAPISAGQFQTEDQASNDYDDKYIEGGAYDKSRTKYFSFDGYGYE